MIALIISLLPLVTNLTPLLMELIAQLRAQPGLTDEAILAHAAATGDANTVAILKETLRLQAEIDGGVK